MKLAAARIFVRSLKEAAVFHESTLDLRVGAGAPELGYVVFETGACDLIVEHVPPDAPEGEQVLVGRFAGLSFNTHDRSMEAAMTSAFVFGPIGAILGFIAGFVRGGRNANSTAAES